MNPSPWTERKDAELIKRWESGQTASVIASAMGLTRNAVIGRAHRLRLSKRVDPIKRDAESRARGEETRRRRQEAKEKAAYERARKTAKIIPFIPPKPVYTAPPRLSNSQCRWPNGDPKKPGFHFCESKAIQGRPYCPEHHERAHRLPTQAEARIPKLRAAE